MMISKRGWRRNYQQRRVKERGNLLLPFSWEKKMNCWLKYEHVRERERESLRVAHRVKVKPLENELLKLFSARCWRPGLVRIFPKCQEEHNRPCYLTPKKGTGTNKRISWMTKTMKNCGRYAPYSRQRGIRSNCKSCRVYCIWPVYRDAQGGW